MSRKRTAILIVLVALGVAGYIWFGQQDDATGSGRPIVTVSVPEVLSAGAETGQQAYEANCAVCHGRNAAGQEGVAPPLVHIIYEPSHHGDESFQTAVARGVPAHHWPFGDMPPVAGLTRQDVGEIVTYIRELQRANGIK